MVNIAASCDLPDIDVFIADQQANTPDLAGLGPGIAVGVGADAVATSLTFVGLEAFILATELSGETLVELLLELQRDPELARDIQTRIRTDTALCLAPVLPRLGLGSTDSADVEETWNELGEKIDETTKSSFGRTLSTPAQNQALYAWRRTLAQVANCLEILVEENIICTPNGPSPKRCRVPAVVRPCVLRASAEKPE